ncbi:MAG: hypothetical protein COA44_04675 [Arcobacter sp.]|nr:MAG: hypothetical protein COA44_04675 [Arcobacter sp.]
MNDKHINQLYKVSAILKTIVEVKDINMIKGLQKSLNDSFKTFKSDRMTTILLIEATTHINKALKLDCALAVCYDDLIEIDERINERINEEIEKVINEKVEIQLNTRKKSMILELLPQVTLLSSVLFSLLGLMFYFLGMYWHKFLWKSIGLLEGLTPKLDMHEMILKGTITAFGSGAISQLVWIFLVTFLFLLVLRVFLKKKKYLNYVQLKNPEFMVAVIFFIFTFIFFKSVTFIQEDVKKQNKNLVNDLTVENSTKVVSYDNNLSAFKNLKLIAITKDNFFFLEKNTDEKINLKIIKNKSIKSVLTPTNITLQNSSKSMN